MDPTNQLLYDRLYQRCPAPVLLRWMQDTPGLKIQVAEFIEQLKLVEARNAYYVKTIVKALIDNVELLDEEGQGTGIETVVTGVWLTEWLYEKYVSLLAVKQPSATNTDVIQYRISPQVKVSIEETPNLISASGTTGFRTWEAALYLSLYVATSCPIAEGSRVLELGAGTGMVSATLALTNPGRFSKLYVTDGDWTLTQQARKNFSLNGIDTSNTYFEQLRWNEDPVPTNLDYVFAADVTYDSTVIPDLCKCIAQSLAARTTCLVAATVRNEHTTGAFERIAKELGLDCQLQITTETNYQSQLLLEETLLFRPLHAPVRIYRISPHAH